MTNTSVTALTAEQRAAVLNDAVANAARKGWTVSSVGDAQAVLQRKKRIGVFWNTLLSILTGGIWLIVVVVKLVNRQIETSIIRVDAYGNVSQ